MHNPVKPTVKLTLVGTEYRLVFDFESIAEAEDITNVPLLSGLYTSDAVKPKINFLRAFFFACAHSEQPNLTFEQAKALVTQQTFGLVWMKVLEAWKLSQPEAEEAANDADPTKGLS